MVFCSKERKALRMCVGLEGLTKERKGFGYGRKRVRRWGGGGFAGGGGKGERKIYRQERKIGRENEREGMKGRRRERWTPIPYQLPAPLCIMNAVHTFQWFVFSVHGGWTSWTTQGRCNAPRCETGTAIRSRSCTNPRPRNGGRPCVGRSYSREGCVNDENCPSKN